MQGRGGDHRHGDNDDAQRAALLLQMRRPADAAREALAHLARHQDCPSALRTLLLAQHQLGNPDDAIATARRLVSAFPDDAGAHHLLGWALHANNRHAEAFPPTQRALELDPGLADAHEQMAWLHWVAGSPRDALASAERALALVPDDPGFLRLQAELLRDRGDARAATDAALAALQRAPGDPYLLRLRGELAMAGSATGAAVDALRAAVRANPQDARARAELLHALRTDHWAHRTLWRLLPRVPEEARIWPVVIAIGVVMVRIGELDRAAVTSQPTLAVVGCALLAMLRWNSLRLLFSPLARPLLHPFARAAAGAQIALLLGGCGGAVATWLGVDGARVLAVRCAQIAALFAFLHVLAEGAHRERRRGWDGDPFARRRRWRR